MRGNAPALLCAALLSAAAAPVWAQSLGDLARQEAQRRKTVTPGKVYTNDSLKPEPVTATPVKPAAPVEPAGALAGSAASNMAAGAENGGAAAAPAADGVKRDEAYWRGRLQAEQDALGRAKLLLGALQTRISSLQADFVSRDDPVTRAVVLAERQRVLAELDRTRTDIDQRAKAIAGIQEEARLSGAPPAWYR